MSFLSKQIASFTHLNDLHDFLQNNPFKNVIGAFGGRKFYLTGARDAVPLREIVQKLNDLYQKLPKKDVSSTKMVSEILARVNQLDKTAQNEVAEKNVFVRTLTAIKSWMGTFFFNRKTVFDELTQETVKTLELIKKTESMAPKELAMAFNLTKRTALAITDGRESTQVAVKSESHEEIYLQALVKWVESSVATINKGQDVLKDEFKALAETPEAFKNLATAVAMNTKVRPVMTTYFLENLPWPSQALKDEMMPDLCALMIKTCEGVELRYTAVPLEEPHKFSAYKACILPERIIGKGHFNDTNIPLPSYLSTGEISPYLAMGIAQNLQESGKTAVRLLQEGVTKKADFEYLFFGLEIDLTQAPASTFSGKMFAPILPHLKNIPGLVSVKMYHIGYNVMMDKPTQMHSKGFEDKDIDPLLDMIRSHPNLVFIDIKITGMSKPGEARFNSELEAILKERNALSVRKQLLIEAGDSEHGALILQKA